MAERKQAQAKPPGARMAELREALGLSARSLADMLGEDDTLVRRMEAGEVAVWPELLAWLERRAAARRADPPPYGPGRPLPGRQFRAGLRSRADLRVPEPRSDADRLRKALAVVRWSSNALAESLGLSGEAIRLWTQGRGAARPEALDWIERQARAIEADPPPQRVLPGGVLAADLRCAIAVMDEQATLLRKTRRKGPAQDAESLTRVAAFLEHLPGLLRELEVAVASAAPPAKPQPPAMPAEAEAAPAVETAWPSAGELPLRLSPRPPGSMTAERLAEVQEVIGWTDHDLAQRIEAPVMEREFRRMRQGRRPIMDDVADWLERLAAEADQRPDEVAAWMQAIYWKRQLQDPPTDASDAVLADWARSVVEMRRLAQHAPEGAEDWLARLTEVAQDCPPRLRSRRRPDQSWQRHRGQAEAKAEPDPGDGLPPAARQALEDLL